MNKKNKEEEQKKDIPLGTPQQHGAKGRGPPQTSRNKKGIARLRSGGLHQIKQGRPPSSPCVYAPPMYTLRHPPVRASITQ